MAGEATDATGDSEVIGMDLEQRSKTDPPTVSQKNDGFIDDEDLFSDEDSQNESPVIDFILQFCSSESKESIEAKLLELGVETLSDLGHIDFEKHFCGLLKAVQISKLKQGFEQSMLFSFQ